MYRALDLFLSMTQTCVASALAVKRRLLSRPQTQTDTDRHRQTQTDTDRHMDQQGQRDTGDLYAEDPPMERDKDARQDPGGAPRSPGSKRKFARQLQAVALAEGETSEEAIPLDDTPRRAPAESTREHVRCMIEKYERLNQQLGEHREKAWNEGLHLWVLAENDKIVCPLGFMPVGVEACESRKFLENYHLRCWTCGLTHVTARWKSLKTSKCAYTQLASGKQVADIERIPICARVIPKFEQYLSGLNRRDDRRAHHWPAFVHNEGNYQLKCTKCGVTYPHHKKHLMLRASCSKSLQEKVLCKDQIAQDIPIPTKLIQPGGQLLRGGLIAKFASLNLGTLKDKQEMLKNLNIDVFALQETCVPVHRRTATTKAFRACGATITYAHVSEGDVRKRGKKEGVRLGSGLSCVAFEPWQVHAVDSTLPNTPERARCQHRLHTSVVTNGSTYILLHNLYMSPYENPGLLRDLVDTLAVAIQAYPHSYHIIAGDWQQPATHTSFGGLLLDAGWVPHESLYGHAPTNYPYAGAPRRLDELWISPTLAHYVSGVGQSKYAGFSTHELLQVSFRFEEQAIV